MVGCSFCLELEHFGVAGMSKMAYLPFSAQTSLRHKGYGKWGWRRRTLLASSQSSHITKCGLDYSLLSQEPMVHLETDAYTKRVEELKQRAAVELFSGWGLQGVMRKIDTLQHLGVGYHFEKEIDALLDQSFNAEGDEDELFCTALHFRLLRERGHNINSDIFHKFLNRKGQFKESLSKNLWGLQSLYEASYLGVKDEEVLSQAMEFSRKHLRILMPSLGHSIAREVGLALESPWHRRMRRSEARSCIEKYKRISAKNSDLIELAALDFNMVQSLHQKEIAELLRWWKELGLAEKLSFARDRPLECFLWTVGVFPEPYFSRCRIEIAKAVAILLVIDDIYDSYGSLHELALFTDAIKRWETDAIEQLPEYMKIVYMALYNTTNETGYRVLKEYGWFIVPHLQKTWKDICQAFLTEARWFSGGVVPSLQDYLSNGITTAGTYMALVHAFFLMGKQVGQETISLIDSCPKIFNIAGRILRLWDDLGTARDEQQKGDLASSIQCYMKENPGSSDDDARLHVRKIIHSSWEDLNALSLASSPLPRSIVEACLNLARTSQAVYQHGDDKRAPSPEDHILSLLIKPIQHGWLSKA